MGVGDWLRQLVPFRRRNLHEEDVRAQSIRDAVEECRRRRAKSPEAGTDETDSIFDELLDAFEDQGLDPEPVWRAADRAFPDNPRWLEALASRAITSSKTDRETLEVLRRQAERVPENLPLLLRLIECYRAAGDSYMDVHLTGRVRAMAKKLLETPEGEELPRGVTRSLCRNLIETMSERLAAAYLGMGREDEEAMDLYLWVLERDSTATDFLGVAARYLLAKRSVDPRSIEIYEAAIAFDPRNIELQRFLATHYLSTERWQEGLAILRRLARGKPSDPEAEKTLLNWLREHPDQWSEGDWAMLVAWVKAHPQDRTLVELMAAGYSAHDDMSEDARLLYRLAAGLGIESTRYLRILAEYARQASDWKGAASHYEEIARIEGAVSADVLIPLAIACSRLERTDERALELYQAAIAGGCREEAIHDILCRYLCENRARAPESAQQFRQSLEMAPQCSWAMLGLLRHEIESGHYLAAFEDGLAYLRKNRNHAEVRKLVARALAREPNPRMLAQLRQLGDPLAREILWMAYDEKPSARPIALALARTELHAGNRETKLVPILRTAIHAEPDDLEIASGLAEILWRSGREAEAAEADRPLLAWVSPAPRQTTRASEGGGALSDREVAARTAATRLSAFYSRKNDTSPEAVKSIWLAFDLGVCPQEAILFLARHLAATGAGHPRAARVLEEACRIDPRDSLLTLAWMRARGQRGETREALQWCIEQLRKSPARRALRDLLSDLLASSSPSDLQSSDLGHLRALSASHSEDADLARIVARAHQIAGVHSPQVRSIYERALSAKSQDPALILDLARTYQQSGDSAKAIELYSALEALDPDHKEAKEQLARLYAETHRKGSRALELVREVLKANPADPVLRRYMAELSLDRGETMQGLQSLFDLVSQFPKQAESIHDILERARHSLEAPTPDATMLLARLRVRLGDTAAAAEELARLQPGRDVPTGRLLEVCEEILQRDPGNVRARVERAVILKINGQFDEAAKELEPLAQAPDASPNILGELVEIIELALSKQKSPSNERLLQLARLQGRMGDPASAAQTFSKVLSRDPGNMEIRLAAADAFMAAGMGEEAMLALDYCPPSAERSKRLLELSARLEREERWEQALEAVEKAAQGIELAPEDRRRLAKLQLRVRQEKAAQQARALAGVLPESARKRYELLQEIGAKPSAALFRAYDRERDEVVAFRLFAEGFAEKGAPLDAFRERVEAVRRLHHPGIIGLRDVGGEPGRFYGTFEFVAGINLEMRLERTQGPLAIPEVRRLAAEIAEALAYAHEQGIVHGALRPSRVLISLDGRFKISGFLSMESILPPISQDRELTGGRSLPGMPNPYSCPEQERGEEASVAGDIYSFGAILYYAAVGMPPTPSAPLTPAPGTPLPRPAIHRAGPVFSAVILRCLQAAPDKRFPSCRALLDALKEA